MTMQKRFKQVIVRFAPEVQGALLLVLIASAVIAAPTASALEAPLTGTSSKEIELRIEVMKNQSTPHGALVASERRAPTVIAHAIPVSAYNSVPWQTDDTPCIGAEGTNICEIYARGEGVCAANFVPLGTILEIDGLGTCTVRDRMNARYNVRVDWYMGMDIDAARQHGVRYVTVSRYPEV
ncbi:MAG: 3D domain-containing protein [bacterium]|nr:3D domain-containing protein [bacterium]